MSNVPLFVSTDWLAERLEDPELRLLDATTFLKQPEGDGYYDVWSGKEAYEEEHIPGAVFADLKNDLSDPDAPHPFTHPSRERFVEKISELGVGEGTYVVVYDRGAVVNAPEVIASDWASRLAWQLNYEGFDDVAVLDGGLGKWKDEGRPVTQEPGSYPEGNFNTERNPELFADKDDVLNALDDDSVVILDSLAPQNYRGEVDTYGRPGHIPGSENVFFGALSDPETQELYDDEKLKEMFEGTGALDPDKKVITYCGSAIAATWTGLALNKLGQDNVTVYDGSLTEWTQDDSLPMETE